MQLTEKQESILKKARELWKYEYQENAMCHPNLSDIEPIINLYEELLKELLKEEG